jgi:predicted branched-subunit amino acid permease
MRRFIADPDFRAGFVDMLPATLALVPFGLVCGVGAAAAGASLAGAIGLSAIVFSGAAQILAVQLLAAGAPLAVIVLTCFVAGLRFLIYSAAMAPYLRPLPRAGRRDSRSC